ncbi:MAG: cobalamin-dependent protein [Candidatus Bathyarchaeia archaeon]|jgi:methanogenic corrinoid protein MtbC1
MDFAIDDLQNSIIQLDIDKATMICKELASSTPSEKFFNAIGNALNIVGEKYESGEYFLSELIMVGEVVNEVLKLIKATPQRGMLIGTVVLATVKGDIHDIGKNIVGMLLRSSGFEVVDLGCDISSEQIAASVKEKRASILGLSALLTTTIPEFGRVVDALEKDNLKGEVKTLVGGAAVNEKALEYGVDRWARTAVDGLRICKQIAATSGRNEP